MANKRKDVKAVIKKYQICLNEEKYKDLIQFIEKELDKITGRNASEYLRKLATAEMERKRTGRKS